MNKRAEALRSCLHSSSMEKWTLHVCLVQKGDTIDTLFAACDGRSAAFPPTLTDYSFHLFIYGILRCSIKLLRVEFQSLYSGGPFTADKTQSINTLPLGYWQPTSLYLKGICVICKAASV